LTKNSKHGQDILVKLIALKARIVDRQNEWATKHTYPGSPAECSLRSFFRQDTGITLPVRDVFRKKIDYRTEFEQLLGGKVEDSETIVETRPWLISSPQTSPTYIPSPPAFPEMVQKDENGQKTEGIEFKTPQKPV